MSIWGKIGGAAAGMLVGGPLGAALGVAAGHYLFDRAAEADGGDPGLAFTIAMIALSAKMAKADGVVTEAEVEAFDRIFRVPPEFIKIANDKLAAINGAYDRIQKERGTN
jgi:DnaJ like chaperone protein